MYIKESDVQKAVEQTGFGKFNYKIAALGALIYLNCGFCLSCVGFVNSTAACDYEMNTIDKGRINISLTIGMVMGTCIWGCFSDLTGRRGSLLISLFMQFFVDALAAVVPSYWAIVFLKVFSGIGLTGQMSILFPYIGEFQPAKYRNQIMSWMELFWSFGLILVALMAWAVIPIEFKFKTTHFWFSSWNLFALLCSIPSLLIGIFLLTLPESPKFLAESGKVTVLSQVLSRMFVENTGRSDAEFKDKLSKCGVLSLNYLVNEAEHTRSTDKSIIQSKSENLNESFQSFKSQIKMLCLKPYLARLFMASSIALCLSSTCFSLMIWFPELLQRFAAFETAFPNETASICTVSEKLVMNSNSTIVSLEQVASNDPFGCETPIHTSVFVNSIWLGVSYFPGAVLLPLTVDRLGYRVYLILTALISCGTIIGFFYVENSLQNLILSGIFEACTSINVSIIFCMLVELFPTSIRVLASAVTIFMSRVGSLFGNMLFSYLIDDYCSILLFVMTGQLIFATVICWMTPSKAEMDKAQYCGATLEQIKL